MNSVAAIIPRNWQRFALLVAAFFVAATISCFLPTPDSWSDLRSQWAPPAAIAFAALVLFIATFGIYRLNGTVFKVQAVILWLLAGAALVLAVSSLYECITFLHQVRGWHV
ncbi:MAG TPA: hypothetical protein VJA21_03545 [Verrucomicrobiae bacterium]